MPHITIHWWLVSVTNVTRRGDFHIWWGVGRLAASRRPSPSRTSVPLSSRAVTAGI